MKKQRGITLIALVITIIVLLILAAVSITALTDEDKGVVTKAKQAATQTGTAADEEDADIQEILDYADSEDWGTTEDTESGDTESGDTDSSTEVPITGITFSFNGTEYQMEDGMTWAEWVDSEYYVGSTLYTIAEYEEKFGHLPGALYLQEDFDEMGVVYVETSKICIASDNRVTYTGLMYYDENKEFVLFEMYTNGVNAGDWYVIEENNTSNVQYASTTIVSGTNYVMYYD